MAGKGKQVDDASEREQERERERKRERQSDRHTAKRGDSNYKQPSTSARQADNFTTDTGSLLIFKFLRKLARI